MKWAINTKVFDNGKTLVAGPFEVPADFKSTSVSHSRFDSYTDVFEFYWEAMDFKKECKR